MIIHATKSIGGLVFSDLPNFLRFVFVDVLSLLANGDSRWCAFFFQAHYGWVLAAYGAMARANEIL